MAVDTVVKPGSTKAFPTADVEAKLRELLLEDVVADAELKGTKIPTGKAGQFAAAVQLDSLRVVDLLCGIESLVGIELQDSLVKAGGYKSINEAVGHLMPRIESAWQKHGNKGDQK
jgi:acyl carrier protein